MAMAIQMGRASRERRVDSIYTEIFAPGQHTNRIKVVLKNINYVLSQDMSNDQVLRLFLISSLSKLSLVVFIAAVFPERLLCIPLTSSGLHP